MKTTPIKIKQYLLLILAFLLVISISGFLVYQNVLDNNALIFILPFLLYLSFGVLAAEGEGPIECSFFGKICYSYLLIVVSNAIHFSITNEEWNIGIFGIIIIIGLVMFGTLLVILLSLDNLTIPIVLGILSVVFLNIIPINEREIISEEEAIILDGKINNEIDQLLSSQNISTDFVDANISTVSLDGERIVDIEYKATTEGRYKEFYKELTSYKPGQYKIVDSEITKILLEIVVETIDSFLISMLEKGEVINVYLYGYTDKKKYSEKEPKYYNGNKGSFPKIPEIDEYPIEVSRYNFGDDIVDLKLKEGKKLNNEILGFLRSFCMYDERLKEHPILREVSRKTLYQFHSIPNNLEEGEKIRRTGVRIQIIPTLRKPPSNPNGCHWFFRALFILAGLIFPFFMYQVYKISDYKDKDQEQKNRQHTKYAIISLALSCLLLGVSCWFCPELIDVLFKIKF